MKKSVTVGELEANLDEVKIGTRFMLTRSDGIDTVGDIVSVGLTESGYIAWIYESKPYDFSTLLDEVELVQLKD